MTGEGLSDSAESLRCLSTPEQCSLGGVGMDIQQQEEAWVKLSELKQFISSSISRTGERKKGRQIDR